MDTPTARMRFQLRGDLGGDAVNASYAHGVLTCDPLLEEWVATLVDYGENVGDAGAVPILATATGDPIAVLLTLLRALGGSGRVQLRVDFPT